MKIAVNMLEHSPRVKVRSGFDKATVARYREAYENGELVEAIVVFRESGTERYVISDGGHRTEGAQQAGVAEIDAEIRDGDETDALKYALGCNAKHGLLRRDSDVQACIKSLMLDPVLSDQYRTHQERSELLGMSYKTFQRHFAKWRQSKGGTREERAVRAEMQERAEKKDRSVSTGKEREEVPFADTVATNETADSEPVKQPPKRKREPKVELTPEQKRIAKQTADAAKRDRLDQANRKTFVEGIDAILAVPLDGAERAKRWADVDEAKVRAVRGVCDEFLKARLNWHAQLKGQPLDPGNSMRPGTDRSA
jgi:hypothetical protein